MKPKYIYIFLSAVYIKPISGILKSNWNFALILNPTIDLNLWFINIFTVYSFFIDLLMYDSIYIL